ncbi:hypothetical protein [Streptomyces diastaticus]|uniref:hypothetical protein n=1 Tax=Streptomyces diastaticus TaxID=1956 RepID=UPI00369D1C4D
MSPDDLEVLRREWAAGTSTADIANLLRVASSTVSVRRRDLGLPSRLAPRVSQETAAAIGRERRAGVPLSEIARRLGVELHVVKGQLKKLGLSMDARPERALPGGRGAAGDHHRLQELLYRKGPQP